MVLRHPHQVPLLVLALAMVAPNMDVTSAIRVLRSDVKLGSNREGVDISGALVTDPGGAVTPTEDGMVEDLTMCARFKYMILRAKNNVIHISDWRYDNEAPPFNLLWFRADHPTTFFGFGHPKGHKSTRSWILQDADEHGVNTLWFADKWTHVCFAYEKKTGFTKVIRDGEALNINHPDPDFTEVMIPADFLTKVYVGRCAMGHGFACSTPESQIADVNIWGRSMTTEQAIKWTTCKDFEKGDLMDWDEASFELTNSTLIEVPMSEICTPVRPGHVIVADMRNFTSLLDLCRKFKGRASVVDSRETQDELDVEFRRHAQHCYHSANIVNFWGGWWDVAEEGTFADANTGAALGESAFAPWYYGEPNGNKVENCVVVWPGPAAWNDDSCQKKKCGFCQLEEVPVISLRGLCLTTAFDTKYSWSREVDSAGFYGFRGYIDSVMERGVHNDTGEASWTMSIYDTGETYAVTTAAGGDYPFGSQPWRVVGDPCYDEQVHLAVVNMNACNESEFNCQNGHCIPMEARCDLTIDCQDNSDEINCKLYEMEDGYLKAMPPEAPSGKDRAEITVGIDVLAILDIAEVDSYISIQFTARLTWADGRLTMLDLNHDEHLNTLTLEERFDIWIPQIIFYNTDVKTESLNDEKAYATVRRNGSYVRRDQSYLHNAYLFAGTENPITISRVYSSNFICEYDMSIYPFDTQRCSAVFTIKGNLGHFVELVAGDINYLGPIELPQYFVQEAAIHQAILPGGAEAVQVDLVFGRRILNTILSTYFPTFLICLMSFATNYFGSFFFEAIVTVNLTSLLVLTTLFIGVSDSLPQTSYIKAMDIWLLFCLAVPFTETILQTYLECFREERETINHHGKARDVSCYSAGANANNVKINGRKTFLPSLDDAKKEKSNKKRWIGGRRSGVSRCLGSPGVYRAVRATVDYGLPVGFVAFTVLYFVAGSIRRVDQQSSA